MGLWDRVKVKLACMDGDVQAELLRISDRTGYSQSSSANYSKSSAGINQSLCTIFLRMCRMQV